MILPLSCHGTFPRALALIEWKLNLLTFFSACYSSVHGATVHTFCPNSDFQYLLEQTGSCFSLTSVLRFLSHSECIMLHLESSCCVYWPRVYCGKGFTTLAVVFLYFFSPPHLLVFQNMLRGSVWSVCCVKCRWGQRWCRKQAFLFFPPVCSILLRERCCRHLSALTLKATQWGIIKNEFSIK